MPNNRDLIKAFREKKDEFYTQLTDIEKEMKYYKEYFKDKIVFCNCDDPESSNFWRYFQLNFTVLGLKKLISTHYEESIPSYKLEYSMLPDETGQYNLQIVQTKLKQNGDFRSSECIEIMQEADIVTTNPPFSLFREFVMLLINQKKDFIILGNVNAITYKEIFPLIMNNQMWLGASIHSGDREFRVSDDYPLEASNYRIDADGNKYIRVKGVRWYTNIDYEQRHEDVVLYKNYNENDYPKFDNYDAINVGKVTDIPIDYFGVMGVPITFLDKYNPNQFEIVGRADANIAGEENKYYISGLKDKGGAPLVNGKFVYKRVLIRRIQK